MNNRHTGLASVVACLLFCLSSCGDAASRQGVLEDSLNFQLPTAWVDGNVTLTLERLGVAWSV